MTGEHVVRALEVFLAATDAAVTEAVATQGKVIGADVRRAKWVRVQEAWQDVVVACGCARRAYAAIEAYANGRAL